MKVMFLKVTEDETRKYTIVPVSAGWFDLNCDGCFIARLISEEECRRVIWAYWTNFGVDMDYITDADFNEVDENE